MDIYFLLLSPLPPVCFWYLAMGFLYSWKIHIVVTLISVEYVEIFTICVFTLLQLVAISEFHLGHMIDNHYQGADDIIVDNIGDVYHPKVGRILTILQKEQQFEI